MAITVEIKNYQGVLNELVKTRKDFAKCVSKAMVEVGTRGIKTAAQQTVRKTYNVTVADVNSKFHYDESGGTTIDGVRIPFFVDRWEQDKAFTVAHKSFGMKPKARKSRGRAYDVTFKPLKSGAVPVTSHTGFPVFIASPKGSTQPYARTQARSWVKLGNGWHHTAIDMVPTHLSVPQMIDNEKVQPKLEKEVNNRLEKALSRYLK